MANSTLWISEFASYGDPGDTTVPAGAWLRDQLVTVGDVAASSSAFLANTRVVRLVSDVACAVAIGQAPVVTSASTAGIVAAGSGQMFLPANVCQIVTVPVFSPTIGNGAVTPYSVAAILTT